jgi:epoxyqueuosine reductase
VRSETLRTLARECGFELAGVTSALPAADAWIYGDWVSSGMAGRMSYLTDHRAEIRRDPRNLLPSAQSIICVGKLYKQPGDAPPHIARYAGVPDYHGVMKEGLERLATRLSEDFGSFDYRCFVDTGPLLERTYARMAGLGWIGRNTCLINQDLGSWLFLGEIVTSLALEPDTPPPDRCGTCTRCIDACPTDALIPGGLRTVLDSTRCISYHTIEHRGVTPEVMRAELGDWVFGCDICQDVCPWNNQAAETLDPAFASAINGGSLEEFAQLTPEEFHSRFRHTPVWRAKYSGFLRNVAIAMGNSRDTRYRPVLLRLAASEDEVISAHAAWALKQLANR